MRSHGSHALLLGALLPAAAGFYSKHDKVERLDADTFDTVTEDDALWLVEFYAPWCGHCQQLAPEWKSAAKTAADELGDEVRLGAVDCTRNHALCAQYKVDGYPTLKVFGEEKDTPSELTVGRTAADILTYVRGKLGKPQPGGAAGGMGGMGDGHEGDGVGGGSAVLDDAWKATEIPPKAATHLFTVAYAVALFAPRSTEGPLSVHVVETAPHRVASRGFDWGPLGALLRRTGHPCGDIRLTLIAPFLPDAMHNMTRDFPSATVDGCGVTATYWRNFYDSSAVENHGALPPDLVVWLNVDAYMCPWRYSLLHSLTTAAPVVLSFFDERPAKTLQGMMTEGWEASFGEEQQTKCDEMATGLYGFKWMAHKVQQNWTASYAVQRNLIDVFLPVAPNQFTVQDPEAPPYTDPSSLVQRDLELNAWLLGVWYDRDMRGAGVRSLGESEAVKQGLTGDMPASQGGGGRGSRGGGGGRGGRGGGGGGHQEL